MRHHTHLSFQQFAAFLAQGDRLEIILPTSVISPLELPPVLETKSRFELPPPFPDRPLDDSDQPVHYQNEWAQVASIVYRFGGRIIYSEASKLEYKVTLELPPVWIEKNSSHQPA